MAIYRDHKRGTYYVDYKLKDPATLKYRHVLKRGFKTKAEAREWEEVSKREIITPTSKTNITFKEMAKRWEDYMDASEGSKRQHREHFEIRFSNLYDKPIENITRSDLLDWKVELGKMNYATKTKNTTIGYVKSVFNFAQGMYDLPNPSIVLKKCKRKDDEVTKEMEVWTPEEFDKFASNVENMTYRLYFEFLFWTGCRRGEAIALQKGDVSNGWVNIRFSQRDRTKGLKPTKTRQTRRIQLDDRLWKDLQPLLDKPGKYVFGGEKGLTPTQIDREFKKAIVASKVKPIRIHDLRHSHATWLINSGVNIVAVSKRLGHSNIEQTLKTYTHLLETSDQNMMSKINDFRKQISFNF